MKLSMCKGADSLIGYYLPAMADSGIKSCCTNFCC
jgi:hypothetical protein